MSAATIDFTHVLCAVDFSESSQRAAGHAVALARRYTAKLTLFHAFEVAPLAPVVPDLMPAIAAEPAHREFLLKELGRMAAAAGADAVPLELVIAEGRAAAGILAHAAAGATDLIVLGTHGRTGLDRLVIGSVTERVLHRAPCPVLAVPPRGADRAATATFRRILCGVDFSPCSIHALDYARSLARHGEGRLTIVNAFEAGATLPHDWRASLVPDTVRQALVALEAESLVQLNQLLASGDTDSGWIDAKMVYGRPAQELLRLSDEGASDLIVLGARGRDAADLFLFGSITNEVVRNATCPVLVVNAK